MWGRGGVSGSEVRSGGQGGGQGQLQECELETQSRIDAKTFQLIVRRLLIEEAMHFTDQAMAKKEALRNSMHDYGAAHAAADELRVIWKKVTPRKFLRWFAAMEDSETHERRKRLLESLLFTVPFRDEKLRWQPGVGDKHQISFGRFNGDVMSHGNAVMIESGRSFPLPRKSVNDYGGELIDFKAVSNEFETMLFARKEEKYCLAYTSVHCLFEAEHLPDIVYAIENAAVKSGVFDTPIVHAILTEAWRSSQKTFYFNFIMDVVVIAVLSRVAVDSRRKILAHHFNLGTLAVCSTYHFIGDVLEVLVPIWRGGNSWRHLLGRIFGSFWALFDMMISSASFVLVVMALNVHVKMSINRSPFKPPHEEWFSNHSIWLVILLATKSTHLIIQLLCVRCLGQRIVPAYHAMTHPSSKAFLFFLSLMFINAVLTFHAVPIDVYSPKKKDQQWWDPFEDFFDTTILQFHRVFLGASQPDELEQQNKEIEARVVGGVLEGELSLPSTHTEYHHGVQVLNVSFMMLIHIIMLNVYINVLGNSYEKAVKRKHAHFEKFRAVFSRKTLTRCPCCMRRNQGELHCWIAYKKRLCPEERVEGKGCPV